MREAKAAIGFRAKTGRAIVVALAGTVDAPAFLWRQDVSLVDPDVPETAQPYHQVMEMPWSEGIVAVKPFAAAIEAIAGTVLSAVLREIASKRLVVRDVGIVGSLDRSLESLGNPHIRAHAAEGILFRRVLETAATKHELSSRSYSERTVTESALSALGLSRAQLASGLKKLGAQAGPPWRADEKSAATAAWIALGTRTSRTPVRKNRFRT
ncbi:MAG: hypothetical protein ACXVIJ_03490 [Thermoanaerobaculia bacterium]